MKEKKSNQSLRQTFIVLAIIAAALVIFFIIGITNSRDEESNEFDMKVEETTEVETTESEITEPETEVTTEEVTTETPETDPSQNSENQRTVYITSSGKKYHYENPCGKGTYSPISLDEALKRGLEPCEKCVLH